MQTITKLKLSLISTLSLMLLSGCGGGGGSDASFESGNTGTTVASCSGAISTWTTVNSGDVVSATSGTQLKFDHDSSNNKKVCVVITTPAGSATIQ
jgi:uncharacterized lipoprotein YehR (DUF1307 family)